MESFRQAARRLRTALSRRGIVDQRVLDAIETTPRELFVDPTQRCEAYEDYALAIAAGQTISQPYVVARMTELLELTGSSDERALEIGTGSGYQTAVLSRLTGWIVSIERIAELQDLARARLIQLGCRNLELHLGDGTLGWPAGAPYDAVIVTAAAIEVPAALYEQLKPNGRLVIPVGGPDSQVMKVVTKGSDGPVIKTEFACRFVPLIAGS